MAPVPTNGLGYGRNFPSNFPFLPAAEIKMRGNAKGLG